MNNLKFYPLFIGGFVLALTGLLALLASTMFLDPFVTLAFAFVPSMALWYAGFTMLRAAERY